MLFKTPRGFPVFLFLFFFNGDVLFYTPHSLPYPLCASRSANILLIAVQRSTFCSSFASSNCSIGTEKKE